MPLLSAVVPDIPENRAEVAAARLARKVGPLFGVPWPDGPFAGRTWVCDYAKITLSEIARGGGGQRVGAAVDVDQGRHRVPPRDGNTDRK